MVINTAAVRGFVACFGCGFVLAICAVCTSVQYSVVHT